MIRKTLQIFKLSNNADTQYEAIWWIKRSSPTLTASRTLLQNSIHRGCYVSALRSIGQGVNLGTTLRVRTSATLSVNFRNFVTHIATTRPQYEGINIYVKKSLITANCITRSTKWFLNYSDISFSGIPRQNFEILNFTSMFATEESKFA